MDIFGLKIFGPLVVILLVIIIYGFMHIDDLKNKLLKFIKNKKECDDSNFGKILSELNKFSDNLSKINYENLKSVDNKLNDIINHLIETKTSVKEVSEYPDKLQKIFEDLFSNFSKIVDDVRYIKERVDRSSNKDIFAKLDKINEKLIEMQSKMEGALSIIGSELFKNKNEGL